MSGTGVPISQLPPTTTVQTGDVLPCVQNGVTMRTTVGQVVANASIPTPPAGNFLPISGGTVTGNLNVNGVLGAAGGLTVTGNTNLLTTTVGANLGVTGAFTAVGDSTFEASLSVFGTLNCDGAVQLMASQVPDFSIYRYGGMRVFQWNALWADAWQESTGTRFWTYNNFSGAGGDALMTLDGSANLNVYGNAFKPGGGSWGAMSDERVKRDVARYGAGLAEVCGLSPVAFKYNGEGDTYDDGRTYYGLIAQAAQAVMPELVIDMQANSKNERYLPGQLGTQLGPLTLALVNACQELAAKVAALEARLA